MTAADQNRPLAGRRAAVTGSTSGIGLSIAGALAAAGADVVLNGFGDPQPAIDVVSRHGTKVEFVAADLSDAAASQQWVRDCVAAVGGVDILVNNAGIQHVAPIEDFPEARWDAIIAINLSSNFHTMKVAIPLMKAAGWGRIINIASAHGLVASPFKAAYVAAKHGVLGLTKTAALELAETPITVNAICPGFVNTPLVAGQIADQARARGMSEDQVLKDVILAAQPTKRFVEPEHVAAMCVFLCTDPASCVTGSAFSMDGGWTAR